MRRLHAWAVVLCLVACGRTQTVAPRPTARIVPVEQWVEQGTLTSWRGVAEASVAPEFEWRIADRPGGVATLRAVGADAELTPDAPGDWLLELVLRDGELASAPTVALLHVRRVVPDAGDHEADAGPQDAGAPDGGAFDAGVRDAGVPDAGLDAGVRDAGVPDAGFDAGVRDAGVPDAGVDAGVRDAGVFDAGPEYGLDAGAVYLAGTLQQGACWLDALADIFTPNVASVGFDCYFDNERSIIRPTDGVLLYTNTFEDVLREYHCDACVYSGTYPADVLANDTVLPTPCPTGDHLSGFLVSASGEVLHRCYLSSSIWRDSTGAQVFANTSSVTLLALGADGWAFSRARIIEWRSATSTPISGLPTTPNVLATRWSPPDGFLVALTDVNGLPGELWRVGTDGLATRIGSYGTPPPMTSGAGGARLDAEGRLIVRGRDTTQSFIDIAILYEVGRPSQVIYTEASAPLVKMHISSFVTGP